MPKGTDKTMALKETAKYLSAEAGKIPAAKIEFGKSDKVIIRVPYNRELIKK